MLRSVGHLLSSVRHKSLPDISSDVAEIFTQAHRCTTPLLFYFLALLRARTPCPLFNIPPLASPPSQKKKKFHHPDKMADEDAPVCSIDFGRKKKFTIGDGADSSSNSVGSTSTSSAPSLKTSWQGVRVLQNESCLSLHHYHE